ncbi:MAG: helix-turn-helix transcriptional regulator [Mycobacteriales bacterium]
MKLSDMIPADQVFQRAERRNPELKKLWDETAFAREISLKVLRYRTEHSLTQAQLGELVGLSQPAIARLEDGEEQPTLKTLTKISQLDSLSFHLTVDHGAVEIAA